MPPAHRDDRNPAPPLIAKDDLRRLADGTHPRPWEVLGAHLRTIDGVAGVAFSVWAPSARTVSVAQPDESGDARLPMLRIGESGVWAGFAPAMSAGDRYEFAVTGANGRTQLRADPMARWASLRPATASRVAAPAAHAWGGRCSFAGSRKPVPEGGGAQPHAPERTIRTRPWRANGGGGVAR